MVLMWSRATFARFTLDQTLESFMRCHVEAFDRFGGAPRTALPDYVPRNIIRILCPSRICGRGIVCPVNGVVGEKRQAHIPIACARADIPGTSCI